MVGPSPIMTVLGVAVFELRLSAASFGDTCVCLGPQVATVLETLTALPELSQCVWYAAGVDPMGADPQIIAAMKPYATRDKALIPDIDVFVTMSRKVTQFLDGIFHAVPAGKEDKFFINRVVEVLLDDTTLIEVSAESEIIVEQIRRRLGGIIL
jgi:hypothetical protein